MSVSGRELDYSAGGTTLKGYFSCPQQIDDPAPGIIVIHEWWGLNDYIRSRADMLAGLGYCALAVDMYGDGKIATTPDEAGAEMNAILEDMDTGTARLQAAYDALVAQDEVDGDRTAAMGYCFGGAAALHMARIGMPLKAVVSFHGALGSFHKPGPGEVQANVLVCHGAGDAMVSMDDVEAFRAEMDAAEASYEVIIHEEAQHGFTSPEADVNGQKYGIPVGYNAAADADSWSAMSALFARSFA